MNAVATNDDAVQALWRRCCQVTAADPGSLTAVEHFGDSAEMADKLLALVLDGTNTAMAGLARTFEFNGERLSQPGDHWVVLEGDRTREHWLDAHRHAFLNRAQREGLPYDERTDFVVFERLEVAFVEPAEAE